MRFLLFVEIKIYGWKQIKGVGVINVKSTVNKNGIEYTVKLKLDYLLAAAAPRTLPRMRGPTK
jgi:hypothetical protein